MKISSAFHLTTRIFGPFTYEVVERGQNFFKTSLFVSNPANGHYRDYGHNVSGYRHIVWPGCSVLPLAQVVNFRRFVVVR